MITEGQKKKVKNYLYENHALYYWHVNMVLYNWRERNVSHKYYTKEILGLSISTSANFHLHKCTLHLIHQISGLSAGRSEIEIPMGNYQGYFCH